MKNLILFIFVSANLIAAGQNAPVTVHVTDFQNSPIGGEQILFECQKTKKIYQGVSDSKGVFQLSLPGGTTYEIKIKSVGDAQDYSAMEIPVIDPNQTYGLSEVQIMIEQPKLFTLQNVYFETGKSSLKSSSYKELDELVQLLNLKKEMKIEIGGHTDNVGNSDANLILSKERSESVKQYLIQKGIQAQRIATKGYGDKIPIADNTSEVGRKLNRRTEVTIL